MTASFQAVLDAGKIEQWTRQGNFLFLPRLYPSGGGRQISKQI